MRCYPLLTRDVLLIAKQGGKNFYRLDCDSGYPLESTKEDPVVFDIYPSVFFLCSADSLLPVVVACFFLQYLVLVLQAFWVCEITFPGWKDVPGSICVLPVAVPITQIISGLSCSLVPYSFSTDLLQQPSSRMGSWSLPPCWYCGFFYFLHRSRFLTQAFRSLGAFAFQHCAPAYLGSSPCQL